MLGLKFAHSFFGLKFFGLNFFPVLSVSSSCGLFEYILEFFLDIFYSIF